MDNVLIGKIVNTHGIKGEIRIISDFEYKNRAFAPGKYIIINGVKYIINTYRIHKNFDMITFGEFNNINQVLPFVGSKVYIARADLDLKNEEYLLSDLIGMKVLINDIEIGIVNDYNNGINPLLEIKNDNSIYYVPIKGDFIQRVELTQNVVYLAESAKGLLL